MFHNLDLRQRQFYSLPHCPLNLTHINESNWQY